MIYTHQFSNTLLHLRLLTPVAHPDSFAPTLSPFNIDFHVHKCTSMQYRALLRKYRALLGEYRALLREYKALSREYRSLLREHRVLLREHRALWREYRARLRECRALLRDYRVHLRELSRTSARSITARTCKGSSFSSTNTRHRDIRARLRAKLGFSVVAPIKVSSPLSTCGNSTS